MLDSRIWTVRRKNKTKQVFIFAVELDGDWKTAEWLYYLDTSRYRNIYCDVRNTRDCRSRFFETCTWLFFSLLLRDIKVLSGTYDGSQKKGLIALMEYSFNFQPFLWRTVNG